MAIHSSTLAWRVPWMEEPGRLQSMGSLSVGHNWATSRSRFHFHALEKEMATHSSVLAWRIPGMGEPGGLPSMGSHRVGHDWSDLAAAAAAARTTRWCAKMKTAVLGVGTVHGFVCVCFPLKLSLMLSECYLIHCKIYMLSCWREGRNPVVNELLAYRISYRIRFVWWTLGWRVGASQ